MFGFLLLDRCPPNICWLFFPDVSLLLQTSARLTIQIPDWARLASVSPSSFPLLIPAPSLPFLLGAGPEASEFSLPRSLNLSPPPPSASLSISHPNLHNAVSGRSCRVCFVQGRAPAPAWWAGSYGHSVIAAEGDGRKCRGGVAKMSAPAHASRQGRRRTRVSCPAGVEDVRNGLLLPPDYAHSFSNTWSSVGVQSEAGTVL